MELIICSLAIITTLFLAYLGACLMANPNWQLAFKIVYLEISHFMNKQKYKDKISETFILIYSKEEDTNLNTKDYQQVISFNETIKMMSQEDTILQSMNIPKHTEFIRNLKLWLSFLQRFKGETVDFTYVVDYRYKFVLVECIADKFAQGDK